MDPDLTGQGIGKQLLDELHSRLDPGSSYILLVLADNTGARRFYTREGFDEVAHVDVTSFYREHMGVRFPPSASEIPCVVLRRTVEG